MTVASFHLVDVDPRRAASGLTRIGLDRRVLAATSGLEFWRLLGTGRDHRLAGSFQPTRRALFAVWDDDASLDDFLASSPVAVRWRQSRDVWHVRLRLISGHGSWGGVEPLAALERAPSTTSDPVVTLTRAAIRPARLAAFVRHSRALGRTIDEVPGLRVVVGIGDVPFVRLGTVAVWDDDAAAVAAMASWSDHTASLHAARRDAWFAESLFARFAAVGSEGSWSGTDPVAGGRPGGAAGAT